jgi:type I restriction enzyme S subunit
VKAGWSLKPIGEVCAIVGGGTPSRSVAAFFGGAIPWATVRDMKADWIETTEFSITPAGVKNSATNILPAGTVVVASRVGLGKVCRVRQDTAINQDLRGFMPKAAHQLDPQYLFLWFRSVADKIVAAGTGATVQGVTLPFLRSLEIPLPPLEEQRRIVAVLDEAFAAIATATANAERNLANARELFAAELASLFGGDRPGWKRLKLGSALSVQSGFAFRSADYVDEGHFLVRIGNVQSGHLSLKNPKYVQLDAKAKKFDLKAGDILTSLTGDIGRVATVEENHLPAALNQRVARLVPHSNSGVSREFLLLFLRSDFFRLQLESKGHGAAQMNVSPKEIAEVEFSTPDPSTQRQVLSRIALIEDAMNQLTSNYNLQISLLSSLKLSLLHRAFTGELIATAPDLIPT